MSSEELYLPDARVAGTVYRVIKLLGRGGMGNVYDVEDTTVGKRYVLKTLTPDLVGRQDLARRMDAEARVLARLNHPNIVEVITAGQTQDNLRLPYLVMERLNGQTLRTVLDKRGAMDIMAAYRVATDLLDALEHAHENGVVHRDVKPDNVFLHRNVAGTTVTKLLDFGIMRLMDSKSRETRGRFVGTLRYAAPEQILGRDITPLADVYATALVLYEMIAGKGPFEHIENEVSTLSNAQVSIIPARLSTLARVPVALDELIAQALSKDPKERPKDAFTFASELRKLQTISAAPLNSSVPTAVSPLNPTAMGQSMVPMTERMDAQATPAVVGAPVGTSQAVGTPQATREEGVAFAATQASPEGMVGADRRGVPVAPGPDAVHPVSTKPSPGVHAKPPVDRAAPTRSMVQEPLAERSNPGDTMRLDDLNFAKERGAQATNDPVARTQGETALKKRSSSSNLPMFAAAGALALAAGATGVFLGSRSRVAAEVPTQARDEGRPAVNPTAAATTNATPTAATTTNATPTAAATATPNAAPTTSTSVSAAPSVAKVRKEVAVVPPPYTGKPILETPDGEDPPTRPKPVPKTGAPKPTPKGGIDPKTGLPRIDF
jgi:eukaryotic-like serine/threonine-protein kinase